MVEATCQYCGCMMRQALKFQHINQNTTGDEGVFKQKQARMVVQNLESN